MSKVSSSHEQKKFLDHTVVEEEVEDTVEADQEVVAEDTLVEDRAEAEVDTLEDHHVMVDLAEDTAEGRAREHLEDTVEAQVVDQAEATRRMLHHEHLVVDIATIEIVMVHHHPQVNNKKEAYASFLELLVSGGAIEILPEFEGKSL